MAALPLVDAGKRGWTCHQVACGRRHLRWRHPALAVDRTMRRQEEMVAMAAAAVAAVVAGLV